MDECTGVTATHCPVHGDCTCPGPTDTGYEPMEYLNADGCPLHDSQSDHAEGPSEVERLRAAIEQHREAQRGIPVLAHDERLWAVLDPAR